MTSDPALPPLSALDAALHDPVRLAELSRTGLLGAGLMGWGPIEALDRLTRLAATVLDVPGALVNLVTAERQVTASCYGPDAGEVGQTSAIADSFCRYEVGTGVPFIVHDARQHPWVSQSIWTRELGLVAYAGIPLASAGGEVLGSFCVFDHRVREWSEAELATLGDLAAAAAAEIRWRIEVRARAAAEAALAAQVEREERLRAEAERARAEAERARAEAEQANAAKSQFLAVMSHELRTPLNAIAGYTDLLDMGLRGPVTEAQRADLARIRRSGQHLLSLINDVLNLARLEAGRAYFEPRDVPLQEVLANVVPLVAPQIAARGLELVIAECDAALRVYADPDRLQQALVNLLTNACKFTDAPGRVAVACRAGEGQVHIVVEDTGIGIPADRLEAIFDPFVQVDPGLARTREGTGLGLAISRDLARGMGGEITVRSTPGAGSTFTLTVPAAGDEGREVSGEVPAAVPEAIRVAARCRVLRAEHGVPGVLAELNRRAGCRYTVACRVDADGVHAVTAVTAPGAPGAERILPPEVSACLTRLREGARLVHETGGERGPSCCAVPVRDESGAVVGALCHVDPAPGAIPLEELPVLEAVAPLLLDALRPPHMLPFPGVAPSPSA